MSQNHCAKSLFLAIAFLRKKAVIHMARLSLQNCVLLLLLATVSCKASLSFGQKITASPSSVTFPNTTISQTATTWIALRNNTSKGFTITGLTTSTGAFQVLAGNGQYVASNATVSVQVGFTPQAVQSYSDQLSVNTSSPSVHASIPLAGTGISSTSTTLSPVAASPTSLSFGSITTGTNTSLGLAIQNTGTTSVSVSTVTISGIGFSVAPQALPYTIAAGSSMPLSVQFSPTTAASYLGSLTVSSNGSPSSLSVALSGTGLAPTSTLASNPTSLSFGNITTGLTSSLPLVISASGTTATTITSIGSNNSVFVPSSVVLPVTLQPGQQLSLAVTAAPTAVGTVSAQITVSSNATTDPVLSIPVTVSGISSTQHYVDLAWSAPSSTGVSIAGYNVYRASTLGGPFALLTASLDPSTTYVDNAVTAGTTYYYQVTSSTGSVESTPSNVATVTIPTP